MKLKITKDLIYDMYVACTRDEESKSCCRSCKYDEDMDNPDNLNEDISICAYIYRQTPLDAAPYLLDTEEKRKELYDSLVDPVEALIEAVKEAENNVHTQYKSGAAEDRSSRD